MNQEYGFTFDPDRCIQCHACEAACKSWCGTEQGIRWRWVTAIWSGIFPQVSLTSISMACQHCVDPECVKACPEAAISKREADGAVLVDSELCSGCQACLDACPFDVPCFGDDGLMQKCDLCRSGPGEPIMPPACTATCPTGALQVSLKPIPDKQQEETRLQAQLKHVGKALAS